MSNAAQISRPYVVRAQTCSHLIWTISADTAPVHGLIRRDYDIPTMRTADGVLTDGDAMRRNLIMTEGQHRAALLARYPGASIEVLAGNGNLGANSNFVALVDDHLVAPPDEPIFQKCYAALTFWKNKRTTIEDVWFVREYGQPGVLCRRNHRAENITAEVEFVTTGQPLVRGGSRVPLDQIVEHFYDTRHLVTPIRLAIKGAHAFVPNAQLQQGLLRMAVDGPVRVALEARIDGETYLPLDTKGWVKLADGNSPALAKAATFLRAHQLLQENEELAEPVVLLRVAREMEGLFNAALRASDYRVIDNLRPLNEGEVCFVNGHVEIYFHKAVYPHNIFVTWPDRSSGPVVYPGKSGREGTTLREAQDYLVDVLGVGDALLLDNGGDVRLTWRGCELVRSSENRAEIRSVLALMALPGATGPTGVSVQ
jgi:hypothetical protein